MTKYLNKILLFTLINTLLSIFIYHCTFIIFYYFLLGAYSTIHFLFFFLIVIENFKYNGTLGKCVL